jgi:hypothetical protein
MHQCAGQTIEWCSKRRIPMDYRPYVDKLFKNAPDRYEEIRTNPVTGSRWVKGERVVAQQKRAACRALVTREWFAWDNQDNPHLPPLPLSYNEREALKGQGGVGYIVSVYARSLEARNNDLVGPPSFHTYACGVMASPYAPDFIKNDPDLLKCYPPRALPGLGAGLYLDPDASP